jgi:hypothetical protein
MRRVLLYLIALATTSCAVPGVTTVAGPYASRLSVDDVRQINAFVEHGGDIQGPHITITAVRSDHATVKTVQEFPTGGIYDNFSVTKRRGRWTMDNPERVVLGL